MQPAVVEQATASLRRLVSNVKAEVAEINRLYEGQGLACTVDEHAATSALDHVEVWARYSEGSGNSEAVPMELEERAEAQDSQVD